MRRRERYEQRTFDQLFWGGYRKGSGRKKEAGSGVSHGTRAPLASRYPVHVTLKVRAGLPGLRRLRAYRALVGAFRAGCKRRGFRLAHYSVQTNHLHLIVEGKDRTHLARGVQGLCVRIARALNRLWKRRGAVFAERYHDRILKTPRQVRNVLLYVLQNCRRHGDFTWWNTWDPRSSGSWFTGWRDAPRIHAAPEADAPITTPRTWLLNVGWRRHGLLHLTDCPAP